MTISGVIKSSVCVNVLYKKKCFSFIYSNICNISRYLHPIYMNESCFILPKKKTELKKRYLYNFVN